jgi:peptidoglycan/LPS O-acetylase OafA/YrhL
MPQEEAPASPAFRHVHYPALDGLRAIAVTLVFLWHYVQLPWGWAGVDVFFALSGFLITGILYDTRNTAHRFRNFYMRRTLRIFPLYYTVLLTLFALGLFVHWSWNPGLPLWLIYLGNFNSLLFRHAPDIAETQSFLTSHMQSGALADNPITLYLGHFWSLCVEEQFYLIWPLVIFFTRSRIRLMWICATVIFLEPLLRLAALRWIHAADVSNIVAWSTPLRLDELLLGALLALHLRGPKPAALHRWAAVVLLVCIVVMCLWRPNPDPLLQTHEEFVLLLTAGISLVAMASIALVTLALRLQTILYRVLCWRPLREIGKVSYGIYVFHDIPHTLYFRLFDYYNIDDPRIVAAFAYACTLALAFLSFHFFESPFLKLKARYTR